MRNPKRRPAVVSVRLSEREHAQLRKIAAARQASISDAIRSLVAQETEPMPAGESVVVGPRLVALPPEGGYVWQASAGIMWHAGGSTFAEGATLTMS